MERIPTIMRLFARLIPLAVATGSLGISELKADATNAASQLETHCFRCHGEEKAKGGLNLSSILEQRPLIKNRDRWNHVVDLIQAGEMPPDDEPQPSSKEKEQLLRWLDQELNHFDYSTLDNPGFEQARRLTNDEYNRTVSDLFGMALQPADRFPTDLTGASGFENSANTLFLPTALMERYIAAAERIVDTVLPDHITSSHPTPSFRRLLPEVPTPESDADTAAHATIEQFLLRAYRRPPSAVEVQTALAHFRANYDATAGEKGFIEGIRRVIQATLISPKFLLRLERGSDQEDSFRISDHELASRLSYFLWSSMPDDRLFELAASQQLHQPDILQAEVDRMLQDPRADTLGSNFAAQWLGFRFMGNRVRLDPIDNPWCTDSLMTAMREESGMFFTSLVRENRSIDQLITANYTFLNQELAEEIYQREDIKGTQMRRVSLKNPNRGGILTHGSLMAITSNYKETSPIKRGNWLLETVLGRPLPPPPPNAGAFSDEVEENDSLTFRQKVELHSSNPSCRSCHSKIDPLGFSLENFDYFGRWREAYRVRVVERDDEEALRLTQAMRALSEDELHQRIADLDSGPDTRKQIRERLGALRQLSDWALEKELSKTISAAQQNRLIRILEWLDIGEEDDHHELIAYIGKLRALAAPEFEERLAELEIPAEEQSRVRRIAIDLRAATQDDLEEAINEELDDDDRDSIFEVLYILGLIEFEEEDINFQELVVALRELDDEELGERIADLDADPEEIEEIFTGAQRLRSIPEGQLERYLEEEIDEEFREGAIEVLLELDLFEEGEEEEEDERRSRRRFEQRPITGAATLPDGTPFQGPQGLKQVILSHHREDLLRQITSKLLAYALGRQLEYFDEGAIRKVMQSVVKGDYRMHDLITGIVGSYPFQYKKNPLPDSTL